MKKLIAVLLAAMWFAGNAYAGDAIEYANKVYEDGNYELANKIYKTLGENGNVCSTTQLRIDVLQW